MIESEIRTEREVDVSDKMIDYDDKGLPICPHCGSHEYTWTGEGLDPGLDYYMQHFRCKECREGFRAFPTQRY